MGLIRQVANYIRPTIQEEQNIIIVRHILQNSDPLQYEQGPKDPSQTKNPRIPTTSANEAPYRPSSIDELGSLINRNVCFA